VAVSSEVILSGDAKREVVRLCRLSNELVGQRDCGRWLGVSLDLWL
jgi:hypothetical protein